MMLIFLSNLNNAPKKTSVEYVSIWNPFDIPVCAGKNPNWSWIFRPPRWQILHKNSSFKILLAKVLVKSHEICEISSHSQASQKTWDQKNTDLMCQGPAHRAHWSLPSAAQRCQVGRRTATADGENLPQCHDIAWLKKNDVPRRN